MKENRIYVLIRHWNNVNKITNCLRSVFRQNYSNYKIVFIDDFSINNARIKQKIITILSDHITIFNAERKFAVRNAYESIHKFCEDDSIVFNLDCDDELVGSNVFTLINTIYQRYPTCKYTYGSCLVDGKQICNSNKYNENKPYPSQIILNHQYRNYPFLPLHPRTWKASAFKAIPKHRFLINNQNWLKYCEDLAIFFNLFDIFSKDGFVIRKILYNYSKSTLHNDAKSNKLSLIQEELYIRKQSTLNKND